MESVWEKDVRRVEFDPLSGSRRTDVLIIGGGIAGVLTAYALRGAGIDCMLVEADRICRGVTGNTTAKITLGHGLIYHKLVRRYGYDAARLYLEAQKNAMGEYARLCRDIQCDYEVKDSYVYSMDKCEKIDKEIDVLTRLGVNAEYSGCSALPIDVAGAVRLRGQAQLHPLKFIYGIAKDLPIYERTKVTELLPHKAVTNRGTITFDKLVVATHFPMINKHGSYFLKMYQHRSYVLALEGAGNVHGMYVDESDAGLSFRNYGDILLIGGGGHRTGKKGGSFDELERFRKKHYSGTRIIGRWATQDCMTLDGMPYVGQYSKNTPGMYVITGFNKWGMTSAMAAAHILSDLVREKKNPYAEVFSPSRSIFHPQLAVNAFESVMGLLTPTAPRCPHMGCALKYNRAEHSWDCPCHGSRFDEDGKVLDNPATDDKKM